MTAICRQLGAGAVQQIGKLLVIYRPSAILPPKAAAAPRKKAEPRRTKRSFQGGSKR